MSSRLQIISGLILCATLSLVGVGSATAADNATTPTTPSSTVPPSPDSTTPAAGTDPGQQPQVQTIESWALGPSGSLDPNKPGDRANFNYDAAAGTVIHDSAIVYNFGNVPLTFHVYATDGLNNPQGAFDLLPGDKTPQNVGAWIKLDAQDLTIPPLKEAVIPFTVTVPADAPPGDHVGGIVASSPIEGQNATGQEISLDRRTGSKVYIRVNGNLHPELAITRLDTSYSHAASPMGGRGTVTFRVENRGDVRLDGTPVVTLSGPFGVGEKKFTLARLTDLLPGGTADLSVDVPDMGAFFVLSTTVEIKPAGAGGVGALAVVKGSDLTFAPPLAVLVGLVVVLIAFMFWRRRRRRLRAEDVAYEAAIARESVPKVAAQR